MDIINLMIGFIARNIKKLLLFVLVAIVLGSVLLIAYDTTYNFIRSDRYDTYDINGKEVTIDIPEGSTSSDISKILKQHGLIENELLFRIKAKLTGAENNFQYGVYKIIEGMNDETIMAVLQEGAKEESVRITIPEGWSVRQIAAYLEEENICLASEFEAACNRTDYDFDYYYLINRRQEREFVLEGFLFPDTYDIIPARGAEGVVKRLLREFERRFEKNVGWQERMKEMGLSIHQVITMASCIEREAMLSEEMPKVSRTLFNRLDEGMTWGLNCTILYALGKEGTGEEEVTYDDMEVESYYNTYKYAGYPVGPICNPGEEAIEAVLFPAEGDWLYFIAYNDGTNEHLFTADYEEFLAVEAGTYVREDQEDDEE